MGVGKRNFIVTAEIVDIWPLEDHELRGENRWTYMGCGNWCPFALRYCRQNPPKGIECTRVCHLRDCVPNMPFQHMGVYLSDTTNTLAIDSMLNGAATVIGKNGPPIFANDIAHLTLQAQQEIISSIVGDTRKFEITMTVSKNPFLAMGNPELLIPVYEIL